MIHSMRQVATSEFICDDCGYHIVFVSALVTVIEQGCEKRGTVQHSCGKLVVDVKELEELLPIPEKWPQKGGER